ncbi:MAG: hypothetical protein AAF492_17010 [Verrucomicrobiota bacterium]
MLKDLKMIGLAVFCAAGLCQAQEATTEEAGTEEATPEEKAPEQMLQFMNGDRLHGNMASLSSDGGLIWSREDVGREIKFGMEGLKSVFLGRKASSIKPVHSTNVRLTNGDRFNADLISMDEEKLVVDTWFGGMLSIRRMMVETIAPGKKSSMIYEGPNEPKDWSISSTGSWEVKDNALHSYGSGTIGMNLDLPNATQFEFDVTWNGSYPYLRFMFYTDNIRTYSGNGYVIRPYSTYIRLYRYANGSSSSLANASYSGFQGKNKARFKLLIDKSKSSIMLSINNQLVNHWVDPNGFAGLGNGIAFNTSTTTAKIRISNIKVSAWDGSVPSRLGEAERTREDVLELANSDRITGKLVDIKENTVALDTEYATLKIPVDRVKRINLSGEDAERARRNVEDVQITLHTGGALTLKLKETAERKLHGSSENFEDPIELALDAIKGLELNLYDEKREELEESSGNFPQPIMQQRIRF